MRNRIKIIGEHVITTRSTTISPEATVFYKKVHHLESFISNKLRQMGIKPEVKKIKQ